jgi:hypothetical protein
MLRKCEHGNYCPSDMDFSYACSGCRPLLDKLLSSHPALHERESDEIREVECPICMSKEFTYFNENSFFCPRCGCDEFTLL